MNVPEIISTGRLGKEHEEDVSEMRDKWRYAQHKGEQTEVDGLPFWGLFGGELMVCHRSIRVGKGEERRRGERGQTHSTLLFSTLSVRTLELFFSFYEAATKTLVLLLLLMDVWGLAVPGSLLRSSKPPHVRVNKSTKYGTRKHFRGLAKKKTIETRNSWYERVLSLIFH